PVTSQRLRMRVGFALRGSSASFRRARKRSSSDTLSSLAIAFSRANLPAYFFASRFRRSFLLIELSLAIFYPSRWSGRLLALGVAGERHLEATEQGTRLLVGLGGGADDDVHAPDLVDLVVVDLGEDDLLFEAEGIVATTVKAVRVHAPEVTHARQRDVDQPVQELVHAGTAQGHLAADRHAFAQLEGCDRLLGAGDDRTLTGEQGEVRHGGLHLLAVLGGFTHAQVDHNLLERRHFHRIAVPELLLQFLANLRLVEGFQPRSRSLLSHRSPRPNAWPREPCARLPAP